MEKFFLPSLGLVWQPSTLARDIDRSADQVSQVASSSRLQSKELLTLRIHLSPGLGLSKTGSMRKGRSTAEDINCRSSNRKQGSDILREKINGAQKCTLSLYTTSELACKARSSVEASTKYRRQIMALSPQPRFRKRCYSDSRQRGTQRFVFAIW